MHIGTLAYFQLHPFYLDQTMQNLSSYVNSSTFWSTNGAIGGPLTADFTLTAAGSPYVCLGITVPNNVSLTIEPGVVCKFVYGASLIVNGFINAIGTDGNWITFSSNQTNPSTADWGGIMIAQPSISFQYGKNYGSPSL